jgi:hypothetical protein
LLGSLIPNNTSNAFFMRYDFKRFQLVQDV